MSHFPRKGIDMAMQKKTVKRKVVLVNNISKEKEMDCEILKAAEKRNIELAEELSLSNERLEAMDTRLEETEKIFDKNVAPMRERLLSALDHQSILHTEGEYGEVLVGDIEIIPCESSFVVGSEVIVKVGDVVRLVNKSIREKGEQAVYYEDVVKKEQEKEEIMESRLELIKKRHKLMELDLEEFDEEENEEFIASCSKEDTDEGLTPLEEEYLDEIFGIEREIERDLPAKKEGKVVFKRKEVEDEDMKWVQNHRKIRSSKCKNHKDVEKDFIESLASNEELAIAWFPELGLLEWEEARKFLRSCVEKEWDEQHADRAVHLYKCGLDS